MRRLSRLLPLSCVSVVLALSLMGAACNRLPSPTPTVTACTAVGDAKIDMQLCADATYGVFVTYERLAAQLAQSLQDKARANAGTDADASAAYLKAKDAIIAADERAKPIADKLYAAIEEVAAIKAEIAASGDTNEARLLGALQNLNRWVTDAGPLVADLVNAVKGVPAA